MFNPVALSNLIYDRTRLLIGIAGVAFAVLLVFINLGFLGALTETAGLLYNQLEADVYVISPLSLTGTSTKSFSKARLLQANSQPDVLKTIPLYIGYSTWRNEEKNILPFILCYGFNPRDKPFLLPEVQSEQSISKLLEANTVFFDKRSLPQYGPAQVGRTTELSQQQTKINGTFALGGGLAAEGSVLMSDQNFLRYFSPRSLDRIDLGLIQLKPGANTEAVVQQLRKQLPSDVSVYSKAEIISRDRKYWMETTAVGFIFSLGVGVALIVGAAIVYQILYADISKNYKEYATLKAIGFKNRFLVDVILQEAFLLGVLGYIPGLILAWGAYDLILKATNDALPMTLPFNRIVLVLGLAIATCIIAGLLSLRKILVADPATVL